MNPVPAVRYQLDGDGVGWLELDDPAGTANVVTTALRAELASVIRLAARQPPKALVFISGKERNFSAGGDLKWLATLTDAATATAYARAGQQLCQQLADFPVPVVGAIHGACAGGGLELALACHWRIASEAPVTRIGFPEAGLGLIPSWGGTVGLPRLIGAELALTHILQAQLHNAVDARRVGLVDCVVGFEELRAEAKAAALRLAAEGVPARPVPAATQPEYFSSLRESTRAKPRGRQPAWLAAIDVVEQTASLPLTQALEIEAAVFGEITVGAVAKNLIHAFFLRNTAKKRTLDGWFSVAATEPPRPLISVLPIRRVGVVGAGVMGSGIAQALAAGGLEVVMRDVQPELVARGFDVIKRLFEEATKRGKLSAGEAAAGLGRVTTTTTWAGFSGCDLVIEAIVENAAAKRALFRELADVVGPEALLASNTSALPIEEIAGHVPHPARTLGIHFFNPVSRMPLVELVVGRQTSRETAERALGLVRALGKTPVICRSSPGFLVTRVLFFYLNAAVRLWEQGAAAAEIDAAMREFGWPMGPLRLIDEVGVDVADFIFDELQHYFPGRLGRAMACRWMLAAGLKGRKNGTSRGFYRYEGGREILNEAEVLALHAERAMDGARPARGDIAGYLMGVMVDEARRCLEEGVILSPDEVDFALLSGAGFPAFHGGLMRWAAGSGQSA